MSGKTFSFIRVSLCRNLLCAVFTHSNSVVSLFHIYLHAVVGVFEYCLTKKILGFTLLQPMLHGSLEPIRHRQKCIVTPFVFSVRLLSTAQPITRRKRRTIVREFRVRDRFSHGASNAKRRRARHDDAFFRFLFHWPSRIAGSAVVGPRAKGVFSRD